MNRTLDVASSFAATVLRFGGGWQVGPLGPRPAQTLQLFEFEACPFCRKVREALTVLDLEALISPCPRGGTRFRPAVRARGGREQFPYLVDPNTGTEMYESAAIVSYLFAHYGSGPVPPALAFDGLVAASGALASAVRGVQGRAARPSRAPAQPLDLWSYEASPYSRIAREELCALEIPYRLHNVGKHSPSRAAFVARSGRMMVPYLADPNTGREMFESADIVRYLRETYGA